MGKYSDLLSKAINSIISVKEESDLDSFLEGFVGELFEEHYVGLDDFELICFLVIKNFPVEQEQNHARMSSAEHKENQRS